MSWELAFKSVAGFLAIGSVNLLVSFGLALWVALRSRQVRFKHGLALIKILGWRFMLAPIEFFIGPKHEPRPAGDAAAPATSKGQ